MVRAGMERAAVLESPPISAELAAQRRLRFPIGASATLSDLNGWESGVRLQRNLREQEPVTWFSEVNAWLVTSRQLVEEVLGDPDRFTVRAEDSFVRAVLGEHMLSIDGTGHRQQRAPYDPALRLRPVRANYTGLIETLASESLRQLLPRGTAELRSAYASPLAITAAGRALGLDFGDISQVGETYDVFAASMVDYEDPDVGLTTAPARAALDAILQGSIDRLRAHPDSSIISSVLTADSAELRHRDDEVVANLRILLFGAIETVTSAILSTTWALLMHPEQLAEVLADQALFTAAVNEALRWISPVGHTERWATTDTELGGAAIRRGDMLLPSLGAANRDPTFFPDPDEFDIHRANARHHAAFGRGSHHCIGLNLGNLEAQIAVRKLFGQLPGLRLDPGFLSEPSGFGFRSPRSLRVLWQ